MGSIIIPDLAIEVVILAVSLQDMGTESEVELEELLGTVGPVFLLLHSI